MTLAAMRERLGVQIELHDAGLDVGELNVIASPLQSMRDVFDLMATDTDDDWRTISERLSRIPDRVAGYADVASRSGGRAATRPRSGRWRAGSSRQARSSSCSSTWSPTARPTTMRLHADLQARASAAADAYSGLAAVLRDEIGPHARGEDAFGRDAYRLFSQALSRRGSRSRRDLRVGPGSSAIHCGRTGVDRPPALSRIVGDRGACAGSTRNHAMSCWAPTRCRPGCRSCPIGSSMHWPTRISRSTESLRNLECRIAPTQTGGIYYTGPSEDLTRPGRMWWSVPPGVDTFHTWQETTTVFHEGVPGHHLQIGGPSCWPTSSTAGAGWAAGCRGTARVGRCTPSG